MAAFGARRNAAFVTGLALAATVVFFHRALFSGDVFVARDILRVYYPLHHFWAQRVSSGVFPDWYPFDGLGQPFAGMVISGAFHPFNLAYLALPLKTALEANVLLSFPVAFGGVYCLVRRFGGAPPPAVLGGVLFAFSGHLVSSTNNLLYLMAASTLPWAVWGADWFFHRPTWARAVLAGFLAALVLFAGDPQAFALTLLFVVVVAYGRRARLGAALLLGLATLAVSAVQLVPAWQVLNQARPGRQSLLSATVWSTHPLRLLELVLGPLFAPDAGLEASETLAHRVLDADQSSLWVDSLYLGLAAVLLALVGAWAYRRSRMGWALVLCSAVLLWLALGRRGGLYPAMYQLFPVWRAFRYPEKLMAYVSFGVSLGAAAGFQAVLQQPMLRRRVGFALGLGGLLLVAIGLQEAGTGAMTAWIWKGALQPNASTYASEQISRGSLTSGALAALTGASFLWARRRRLLEWLAPVCCFLGALWLNEPRYQLSFSEVVDQASPFRERVEGTGWRVLQVSGPTNSLPSPLTQVDRHALASVLTLEPVTPALYGVEGANTYLPATSTRVLELREAERAWALERARLFATRYFSVPLLIAPEFIDDQRSIIQELSFGYALVEDRSALPRAYVARPLCVKDALQSLAYVQERRFTPGKEAIVECAKPLAVSTESGGTVLSLESTPERVAVAVRADGPSVLVLNDAFYSGWRATLDGAPVDILAANHAVRAVPVGKGEHHVVFTYRTPGLTAAAGISLLTLLSGVAALAQRRRRRVGALEGQPS
jgi:hypothetical protein